MLIVLSQINIRKSIGIDPTVDAIDWESFNGLMQAHNVKLMTVDFEN